MIRKAASLPGLQSSDRALSSGEVLGKRSIVWNFASLGRRAYARGHQPLDRHAVWFNVGLRAELFSLLNMGTSFAFCPRAERGFSQAKIVAIDSDGSLMNDSSSLITVADVNPPNPRGLRHGQWLYASMVLDVHDAQDRLGEDGPGCG